jgi:hypothetical protein
MFFELTLRIFYFNGQSESHKCIVEGDTPEIATQNLYEIYKGSVRYKWTKQHVQFFHAVGSSPTNSTQQTNLDHLDNVPIAMFYRTLPEEAYDEVDEIVFNNLPIHQTEPVLRNDPTQKEQLSLNTLNFIRELRETTTKAPPKQRRSSKGN